MFSVLKDKYETQEKILQIFKDYRRKISKWFFRTFNQSTAKEQQERYYFELLADNSVITPQEQKFLNVKSKFEAEGFQLVTNKATHTS